jgi:hypothetical protein
VPKVKEAVKMKNVGVVTGQLNLASVDEEWRFFAVCGRFYLN